MVASVDMNSLRKISAMEIFGLVVLEDLNSDKWNSSLNLITWEICDCVWDTARISDPIYSPPAMMNGVPPDSKRV